MKQLNIRLTAQQYTDIKTTVEAIRPKRSLQSWVVEVLERAMARPIEQAPKPGISAPRFWTS